MRVSLEQFSDSFDRADGTLKAAKESLEKVPDGGSFVPHLKCLVFKLNQKLFTHFSDIKRSKLQKLRPSPGSSDDDKTIVVTIPDDLELSVEERKVLAKGLTFIPTPQFIDQTVVNDSVDKFFRRVKLHAYFNDPNQGFVDSDDDIDDEFRKYAKKKSTWTPPSVHDAIDDFMSRCRDEIDVIEIKKPKSLNISNEESAALRVLRGRNDIVIKKADKGGSVVVWRKDLYIEEAHRQLSDSTFYKKVDEDRTVINNEIVSQVISDEITNTRLPPSAVSLIEKSPRCSVFYLLPKIHKLNNPGRPVVSACSCPTSIISAFVDDVLQPIVQRIDSYVKDTNQMLRIVKDFSFPDDGSPLLFTMDVKSLYTVIPNHEGLNALKHYLDLRVTQEPPTETILRLAELVLTLNNFEFYGSHYQQVRGVAMGTRMGPSYACLYMGYVEHTFHAQYTGPKPLIYRRYIDDIFGTTTMSQNDLLNYINCFNDFNEAVKFTFDISDSVNFLDVTFTIDSDMISSTVFYKPTDSHSYLRYDSHHPERCKNAIPFSQFLRLRRICSDDGDFADQVENMEQFFLSRGYPKHITNRAKTKVAMIPRSESLREKDPSESTGIIPLVIPYHEFGRKVSHIVHKNAKILAKSRDIGCLFDNNILTAYCNTKNLKERLVHSKLLSNEIPGTFACGSSKCKMCSFVLNTDCVTGPTGSFTIKTSFNCCSCDVIYCILCIKCGELYIGETGRELRKRFGEHRRDVLHNVAGKEVATHFNSKEHSIDDMAVTGLVYQTDIDKRRLLESKLIKNLGTLSPQGLNRRWLLILTL